MRKRDDDGGRVITILHLSDMQFGKNHRFGRLGYGGADQSFDTLLARLTADLDLLYKEAQIRPDLVALTGDLTEWGRSTEFTDVLALCRGLCSHLRISPDRVLVVPGNHDINRSLCEAYFKTCEGRETKPVEPWWPKWESYAEFFSELYADVPRYEFSEQNPYTWFELPELKVVVAGFNSTMRESHKDRDAADNFGHYGHLGEAQLDWFKTKLGSAKANGWLRIGLVHHNVERGAENDDENLQDKPLFEERVAAMLNLVLHGHTHSGNVGWLTRTLPVVSSGSAAVRREQRPEETPNQYQIVRVRSEGLQVCARLYTPSTHKWVGDTRVAKDGGAWKWTEAFEPPDTHGTFGARPHAPDTKGGRSPTLVTSWEFVDKEYLDRKCTPLSDDRLRRYFDGALPQWDTAQDARIPRRSLVEDVARALTFKAHPAAPRFVLLHAAGGEGKSTLLLQAAVDLVRAQGYVAIHRGDLEEPLNPDELLELPPGRWLVVSDDADRLIAPLTWAHRQLVDRSRGDIHFLLAARDTDWRHAGGNDHFWGDDLRSISPGQLTKPDAFQIVAAWRKANTLGVLDPASSDALNAERLLEATRLDREHGSFFGGVLKARFSSKGLRDHVGLLLERLGDITVHGCTYSLRDVLIFVAAIDAIGVDGVDLSVLALLLGVKAATVRSSVVRPLGQEASTTTGGHRLRTRHLEIARAVLAVAEKSGLDLDLGDTYASIVRTAVREGKAAGPNAASWLGGIRTIGPAIVSKLQDGDFPSSRRLSIAVRAAEELRDAQPESLRAILELARTYQLGGRSLEALRVLEGVVPTMESMLDYRRVGRRVWVEWTRASLALGRLSTTGFLVCYGLSDLDGLPLSEKEASHLLIILSHALERLTTRESEPVQRAGLLATALFGLALNANPQQCASLRRLVMRAEFDCEADPQHSLDESVDALRALANFTPLEDEAEKEGLTVFEHLYEDDIMFQKLRALCAEEHSGSRRRGKQGGGVASPSRKPHQHPWILGTVDPSFADLAEPARAALLLWTLRDVRLVAEHARIELSQQPQQGASRTNHGATAKAVRRFGVARDRNATIEQVLEALKERAWVASVSPVEQTRGHATDSLYQLTPRGEAELRQVTPNTWNTSWRVLLQERLVKPGRLFERTPPTYLEDAVAKPVDEDEIDAEADAEDAD